MQKAHCAGSNTNNSFCGIVIGNSISTTRGGWTIGGGVETMFWGHWLARIEYRYADFGDIGFTFPRAPAIGFTANVSLKTNTLLGGLAYKF
jgi:outer membrane immunogenic protein